MSNIYLNITAFNGRVFEQPIPVIIGVLGEHEEVSGLTDGEAAQVTTGALKEYFETIGATVETVNPDNPNGFPPVKMLR